MSIQDDQDRVSYAAAVAYPIQEQMARLDGKEITDETIKDVLARSFYEMQNRNAEWATVVEAVVRRFPDRPVVIKGLLSKGTFALRFADALAESTTQASLLIPVVMRWHRFESRGVERALEKIAASPEVAALCRPGEDTMKVAKKMLRCLVRAEEMSNSIRGGQQNYGQNFRKDQIDSTIERFMDNEHVGYAVVHFTNALFLTADYQRSLAEGPKAISAAQGCIRHRASSVCLAIKTTNSPDVAALLVEGMAKAGSAEGRRAAWVGAKLAAGRFPENVEIADVVVNLAAAEVLSVRPLRAFEPASL